MTVGTILDAWLADRFLKKVECNAKRGICLLGRDVWLLVLSRDFEMWILGGWVCWISLLRKFPKLINPGHLWCLRVLGQFTYMPVEYNKNLLDLRYHIKCAYFESMLHWSKSCLKPWTALKRDKRKCQVTTVLCHCMAWEGHEYTQSLLHMIKCTSFPSLNSYRHVRSSCHSTPDFSATSYKSGHIVVYLPN